MIKIEYNKQKNGYLVITPQGYLESIDTYNIEFKYSIHRNTATVYNIETAEKYKSIIENAMNIMKVCEYPENMRYHVYNEFMDLYFDDIKSADHAARLNAGSVMDMKTGEVIKRYIESYDNE